MSNRLLVGNLPPDVTEQEIEAIMADAGAEQVEVTLNREGDPDKVVAIMVIPNIDRPALDKIANQINGSIFRARTLNAYVPLFT